MNLVPCLILGNDFNARLYLEVMTEWLFGHNRMHADWFCSFSPHRFSLLLFISYTSLILMIVSYLSNMSSITIKAGAFHNWQVLSHTDMTCQLLRQMGCGGVWFRKLLNSHECRCGDSYMMSVVKIFLQGKNNNRRTPKTTVLVMNKRSDIMHICLLWKKRALFSFCID